MHLPRSLESTIHNKLASSNKGIVLYGPRQVGKTTLINKLISKLGYRTLTVNGDQARYLDIFSSRDLTKIKNLISPYQLLFIDEAQRIPEIGLNLKIILDNFPDLKLIVTGSSALDLASKISEPLTGRIWTYRLYPLSFYELSSLDSPAELDHTLEERLIYGSYPEIFSYTSYQEKQEYLHHLSDNYLYRDLLEFSGIKNSHKLKELLKLLAFQIGSQVSFSELGNSLDMSKNTVAHYIDLLEKSFIIFRLGGFSRNLRKEVIKKPKIFFYDLGIRNVLVNNFNLLNNRHDQGGLWENFLVAERIKTLAYSGQYASNYFWRTYTGAELDYLEEKNGIITGYEFKWRKNTPRNTHPFQHHYPNSEYSLINRDNYLSFLTPPLP